VSPLDIVKAAEVLCLFQVDADLFEGLPLGGETGVFLFALFDLSSGKSEIPRPWVVVMPGSFDE
jgi:hypothetical protein